MRQRLARWTTRARPQAQHSTAQPSIEPAGKVVCLTPPRNKSQMRSNAWAHLDRQLLLLLLLPRYAVSVLHSLTLTTYRDSDCSGIRARQGEAHFEASSTSSSSRSRSQGPQVACLLFCKRAPSSHSHSSSHECSDLIRDC